MLEQLTLEGVRGMLEAQLHPSNLELNVAGDFDAEELEALVLRYLGEARGALLRGSWGYLGFEQLCCEKLCCEAGSVKLCCAALPG